MPSHTAYKQRGLRAFLRHNLRWIAGGFVLTYFSSFGQTYFVAASVAHWQAAFGLSHGEFGRLYMFATLGSALCLPFLGRVVDAAPPHRVILFVMTVLAAAALLAGFASSLPVLFGAVFLLRLFGQGMMTHVALTATGRWFAADRGRAVSLVVLGHQGGEASIPLAFAALTLAYGHRVGWLAAALALLAIGLPCAWWCYRTPRKPDAAGERGHQTRVPSRDWTRREVLRDPIFWVILSGVLGPAFIGTTVFYHQNYMTTLQGWPARFFADTLVVMAATTVVCALGAGALVDRFSARALLPWFLLPLGAACFVLAASGPAEALYLVMVLIGISYGMSSTLFGALWPEIYGVANLGAIRAVAVATMVLATAAGPGLTGSLIDVGFSLPEQMVYLGGYCLLAAAAMTLAGRVLQRRAASIGG